MDKPGNLFFICKECKNPNIVPKTIELCLSHFYGLKCGICDYVHTELDDFKNYAKQTRVVE